MATNYHSDLPNDQIHNPKDFSIARKNSLLIKTQSGELKWKPSTFTLSSTVTCVADVGGTLNNSYWVLYSTDNANIYHVWYNVASSGDYTSDNCTLVEINIAASDSAATIATATASVLNALSGVTAVSSTPGEILVTGITTASKPFDASNTGFGFLSTETATGSEYLQTDSSGNIKWGTAPGGGGEGCSNVFSTITTSPVSQTVSASGCTDNLVISQMNNTRITGNTSADTIQIEAIENITFRGDTTSGLEGGVEYVFNNSNNRANRFLTAMGAGNSLAPASILQAAIAMPTAAGKVISYEGYGSANGAAQFYISLWRFTVECGASSSENPTGTLVAFAKVDTNGNDSTICWSAPVTALTYGGNDILVPSFRWTESTLSTSRVMAKLRII